MIELKTLDKTFQMIHASDHITATIPDGMVFGLIGSNGAGKSTLLRMISGILKPDEGEVLIDGESVFENPSVKSQICFLSDTPYFFPNADIQQMRNYYMLCYPSFNRKLFDSLTDRFNLDPKRKISSFSKGIKSKFPFCSVFVQEQNISSVTKRSTDLIRSFARLLKVFLPQRY